MYGRYWQTLRHLSPAQVAWRVRYAIERKTGLRRPCPMPTQPPRMNPLALERLRALVALRAQSDKGHAAGLDELRAGRFTFLNVACDAGPNPPWHDASRGRLWQYQLHSFGYALQLAEAPNEGDGALLLGWMHDWIAANPVGTDVAWDAYCVSGRLVQWAMADAVFGWRDELMLRSYAQQVAWLLRHIEWDIRANHLLKNACALSVAGQLIGGDAAGVGRTLLEAQVGEQVLADGGHYERAPMYHALAMEDLLAAYAAFTDKPVYLRDALQRMAAWAEATAHPDGDIPLFGDSVQGEALPAAALVGLTRAAIEEDAPQALPAISALTRSGFYSVRWGQSFFLMKACGPEPAFQPGHAHADPFTYELSIDGVRMVVDAGVHGYADSPWRADARSVRAHNCAVVDEREPMDAWGVFRVARRHKVEILSWTTDRHGGARFTGKHDGFAPHTTEREVRMDGTHGVWIRDNIEERGEARLESLVHFAPGATVVQQAALIRIEREGALLWLVPGRDTAMRIEPPRAEPPEGWHFPRFGQGLAAPWVVLLPTNPGGQALCYALVQAATADEARACAWKLDHDD
jgi:uncharacterized heparinase superfamily protein